MVGVIILNYQSADDTIRCVASIEKYTTLDYHLYIVEGASKDDSYARLRDYFAAHTKVTLLQAGVNAGYSYGNNVGIRRAVQDGAEVVCIMNPDVLLLNNAIDGMYDALATQKDVGVVGPRIVGPEGTSMEFARKYLSFANFCLNKKPLSYLWAKKGKALREYPLDMTAHFKFSGSVFGCCFMMRATDFVAIGLLDEKLFLYYEEDVIAFKLRPLHQLSMIHKDAQVFHQEYASTKQQGSAFIRFHRSISAFYVLRHYSHITRCQSLLAALLLVLPFLSLAVFKKEYREYAAPLLKHMINNRFTDELLQGR